MLALKILFSCQNRAVQSTQDSLLPQPLIRSLKTSVYEVCMRDKQEQTAQFSFAQGCCLSAMLTSLYTALKTMLLIFSPQERGGMNNPK